MLNSNLRSALASLKDNRQRSFLSALGIMVASVAILLLVSIAKGVQKDIRGQIDDLGVNVLIVIPGRIKDGSAMNPNIAGLSYLKQEDVLRVRSVPGVITSAPIMFYGGGVAAGKKDSPSTLTLATTPEWFQVHPVKLSEGRVFGPEDEGKSVAVIGSIAKVELFGEKGTAVGKTVDVNGEKCTVLGVVSEKAGEDSLFSQMSFANIAYVPFSQAKARAGTVQVHRIMIQTSPEAEPKALKASVEAKLAEKLDPRWFTVLTQDDLLKMVFKIMGILTWLLTGLTSIALFVGGVGILTVMLMSVNERSKEIGLRKAVGAKSQDILSQFLIEAVLLSLAGGLGGLILSSIVDTLLYSFTPIKPDLNLGVIVMSFSVCLAVGVIFGLVPAVRASRLHPVEALRLE